MLLKTLLNNVVRFKSFVANSVENQFRYGVINKIQLFPDLLPQFLEPLDRNRLRGFEFLGKQ